MFGIDNVQGKVNVSDIPYPNFHRVKPRSIESLLCSRSLWKLCFLAFSVYNERKRCDLCRSEYYYSLLYIE